PQRKAAIYSLIERGLASLASKIIAVSEADRQIALTRRIASPEKIVTIHNGMPNTPGALADREGEKCVRLLMIGRLSPQKDHETLFRALAHISDAEWSLSLIGDGPCMNDLVNLSDHLGISERVEFLGE